MRHFSTLAIAAAIAGLSASAYAELQNVEVGGSIRIRANYYNFDDGNDDIGNFEQRTRLSVKADFTDDVSAFIEVDQYSIWGNAFRSEYFTGVDFTSPANTDEVDLYQAYIQADEMWGTPLRLRVGRQELSYGSEWLVGVNNASSGFFGLSFDAVRLDYIVDEFNVSAFLSLLQENGGASVSEDDVDGFFNNDTIFAGIYGGYTGIEDVVIEAYWFGLWDASLGPQILVPFRDIEEVTTTHTFGLRGAGAIGAFDFEAEIAYQIGDIEYRENQFPRFIYGARDELEFSEFAANLNVGYTFDSAWTPRLGLGYAYFGGGDNEDDDRIFGLFRDRGNRDVAFNRNFSNWEYSEFLENTAMSNVHIIMGTLDVAPTESVALSLYVAYFLSDEEPDYGRYWNHWFETDKDLGLEVGIYADYNYTEDLIFRFGFSSFFAGDGLGYDQDYPFNWGDRPGNLVVANGNLPFLGGEDDDTYHYVFVETELSF